MLADMDLANFFRPSRGFEASPLTRFMAITMLLINTAAAPQGFSLLSMLFRLVPLLTAVTLFGIVSVALADDASARRVPITGAQANLNDPALVPALNPSPVAHENAAPTRPATQSNLMQPGKRKALQEDPRWPWSKRLLYRFLLIPLYGLVQYNVFTISFWAVLLITLLLERLMPAEPNKKLISVSFAHDLVWFIYQPLLHALIVGTYVAFVAGIYKEHFARYTISLPGTPDWLRAIIALVLVDLGFWIQHYINHKVPFLWRLHAVHHSQKQLNFFTDFRYHPLE